MLDYNVDFSQAMPATFSSLVFEMCKHFQVDASLIVPTVLSVSSSLVHDKFKVQICDPVTHGTFQEPLSLFTIGLAESSARKSPVMKLLKAPIQSVLAEQNEVIKAQQYEQKAQKKTLESVDEEASEGD